MTQLEPATPVVVHPAFVNIARLEAQLFSASGKSLAWSVKEGPVGGTITPSGFYIAPQTDGTFHVVAEDSQGMRGEAVVTVMTRQMQDQGGIILPDSRIHIIYWGDLSAFPPEAPAAVESFFRGLAGSPYLAVADQYMRGARATTQYLDTFVDESNSASTVNPQPSEVGAEVCRILDAHGLVPTNSDIFVVYRSRPSTVDPAQGVLCGWHTTSVCHGERIVTAYVAGPAGSNGACIPAHPKKCNSFSVGTTGMLVTTAHEFMETITDPLIDRGAWSDEQGGEISDKCAFDSSYCVTLGDEQFELPSQYSNATQTCVVE